MNKNVTKFINSFPVSENEFTNAQDLINRYINQLVKRNESLAERLNTYSKDEEIQKLQEEIKSLRNNSIYTMNEEEEFKYNEFSKGHYDSCKGNVKIIITHTGIGSAIEVMCPKCGTTENITNYDNW